MSEPPRAALRLGTRRSALARAQTEAVVELCELVWPGIECEVRTYVTHGDRTQESGRPLSEIGGKGVFTAELERALAEREIDVAVHSLKDLPTDDAPGVTIAATCMRDEARDCLISRSGLPFDLLPEGATIGTSSLRRAAQLRGLRHDLEPVSIRGNVDTRIRKVREGEVDAVVLAGAGLERLQRDDEITEWFEHTRMVPAPGQGTLALQCRADDDELIRMLGEVDDPGPRAESIAERTFLRDVGGGCAAPVGAYARATSPEHVRMIALVSSVDGRDVVRVEGDGSPQEVGERLAREALAGGAREIMEAIRG